MQVNLWKALFGKEADKLEQASDDDKTYYIIEKDPIITKYISIPKDKVAYYFIMSNVLGTKYSTVSQSHL